jgi:hypothetical protein
MLSAANRKRRELASHTGPQYYFHSHVVCTIHRHFILLFPLARELIEVDQNLLSASPQIGSQEDAGRDR